MPSGSKLYAHLGIGVKPAKVEPAPAPVKAKKKKMSLKKLILSGEAPIDGSISDVLAGAAITPAEKD